MSQAGELRGELDVVGEVFCALGFVGPGGVDVAWVLAEGGAGLEAGERASLCVVVGPELLLRAAHAGPVAVAEGAQGCGSKGVVVLAIRVARADDGGPKRYSLGVAAAGVPASRLAGADAAARSGAGRGSGKMGATKTW